MKLFVNKELLISDIIIAADFLKKARGIIGQNKPILLKNTNSVHTFFVEKDLDIYFLDINNVVIKKYTNIKPNRIILPIKNAVCVLEFYSDTEKSAKIKTGDRIELSE